MNPHNSRFPQMWNIISAHVDFEGANVWDIGCGGGDFALAVCKAGAKEIYAVDKDEDLIATLAGYVKHNQNLFPVLEDVNSWGEGWKPITEPHRTIISCFSVLPYLDNPLHTLQMFHDMALTVLLEVQLKGDGPGTMTKTELEDVLRDTFDYVQCLGKTIAVKDKHYDRFIWKCTRKVK